MAPPRSRRARRAGPAGGGLPGRPGLDFDQLAELLATLLGTGRVAGLDVAIYDPELDPDGRYAAALVDVLATALAPLAHLEAPA
ncbi:hypothetical protein AB6O49_34120 [Streptomyces sp. SBR177]